MSGSVDTNLYILNEHNIEITSDYIENILKKYGVIHKINNLYNFKLATTHTSYILRDEEYWKLHRSKNTNKELEPIEDPSMAIPLQTESYERIEYLGDAVLHLILADYIYDRYDQGEGFMTKLRTKIEKGTTLTHFAKVIGLNKYILLSRYIEKNNGRENNKKILEDVFEAFLGALHIDGGYDICKKFIVKLIEDEVDFATLLHTEDNYKDMLLQFCHKQNPRWEDPQYGEIDESGPDHNKVYTTFVRIKKRPTDVGEVRGYGKGVSKKKGQQEAAREALIYYGDIMIGDNTDTETIEYLSESDSECEYEDFSNE